MLNWRTTDFIVSWALSMVWVTVMIYIRHFDLCTEISTHDIKPLMSAYFPTSRTAYSKLTSFPCRFLILTTVHLLPWHDPSLGPVGDVVLLGSSFRWPRTLIVQVLKCQSTWKGRLVTMRIFPSTNKTWHSLCPMLVTLLPLCHKTGGHVTRRHNGEARGLMSTLFHPSWEGTTARHEAYCRSRVGVPSS